MSVSLGGDVVHHATTCDGSRGRRRAPIGIGKITRRA